MTRVYMAGCGGMLGQAFHEESDPLTETRCTDIDVDESWLEHLDFRDFDAYRDDVVAFAPDYLFHIGALTDLEYCETHQDDAYATNAMAVENAVYIANELQIPVLYIGTAGIFDGEQGSYDDWDHANPPGIYADEVGRQGVRRAKRSAGPGRHAALAAGAGRLHPVGLLGIPHKLAEPRTGQWLGMKIPPALAWSTVRVCWGCSRVSQEASRAAGRRAACSVCPPGTEYYTTSSGAALRARRLAISGR